MVRQVLTVATLIVAILIATEVGVAAYIDPGPSFMFLQSILAGIIGVLVFFQGALRRVFGFWTRKRKGSGPDAAQS
jgi:hypothetical protein